MRLVNDNGNWKLIDYLPEDIGAASLENFTEFQSLVNERIDLLLQSIITKEFVEMVVQNAINNTLKIGVIFDFPINAKGDVYFRSESGLIERLPIGENGEILKVTDGIPSWELSQEFTVETTTDTLLQSVNNKVYICKGTSLVEITLPVTAKVGDVLQIVGAASGGWSLLQNTGQRIHFGNKSTSITTGKINSTHSFDGMTLMCTTENTVWHVTNSNGNPDITS